MLNRLHFLMSCHDNHAWNSICQMSVWQITEPCAQITPHLPYQIIRFIRMILTFQKNKRVKFTFFTLDFVIKLIINTVAGWKLLVFPTSIFLFLTGACNFELILRPPQPISIFSLRPIQLVFWKWPIKRMMFPWRNFHVQNTSGL